MLLINSEYAGKYHSFLLGVRDTDARLGSIPEHPTKEWFWMDARFKVLKAVKRSIARTSAGNQAVEQTAGAAAHRGRSADKLMVSSRGGAVGIFGCALSASWLNTTLNESPTNHFGRPESEIVASSRSVTWQTQNI